MCTMAQMSSLLCDHGQAPSTRSVPFIHTEFRWVSATKINSVLMMREYDRTHLRKRNLEFHCSVNISLRPVVSIMFAGLPVCKLHSGIIMIIHLLLNTEQLTML